MFTEWYVNKKKNLTKLNRYNIMLIETKGKKFHMVKIDVKMSPNVKFKVAPLLINLVLISRNYIPSLMILSLNVQFH